MWQLLESLQTCQPFLEDSFSCQPSRPKEIWVAPFHTAGVENADRYHSVYHIRSDDPQRDHISLPGDRIPQDPATYSDRNMKMFWGQTVLHLACSYWSLIGWTPSVLLFAVMQLTPQLKATSSQCVVKDLTYSRPFLNSWKVFLYISVRARSQKQQLILENWKNNWLWNFYFRTCRARGVWED